MICSRCLKERLETDFLGKDICFHCQYVDKTCGNRIKLDRFCGVCKKKIMKQETGWASSRWMYCSDECGRQAQKVQCRMAWFRQVRKVYW